MNELERAAGLAATPGYRYAEVVGDELHLAGQVPHDSDGRLVGAGDVAEQTGQCLANLFALVHAHGFTRDDIRHLTVYVVGSQEHLSAAWRAVTEAFDPATGVPPATLLGVNLLGHVGQAVEIDARVVRGR